MNKVFCSNCLDMVDFYTVKTERELQVIDIKIKDVDIEPRCCKCHNPVWVNEIERENLNRFYSKYKQIKGLAQDANLKEIAEIYWKEHPNEPR